MSGPARPTFTPFQCTGDDRTFPLKDDAGVMEWIPVCECPAGFPKELVRIPSKLLSIMPENGSN